MIYGHALNVIFTNLGVNNFTHNKRIHRSDKGKGSFMKYLIISLIMLAFCQIANAGYFEIKPVKVEKWMTFGYLNKNFKRCNGKWYRKHIKCNWVKK